SSLVLSSLVLCSGVVAWPASVGVAVPPHAASTSTSTPALTAEYAVRTMPASSRRPHRCSTYPNVLPVTGGVNGPRMPRPTFAMSRTVCGGAVSALREQPRGLPGDLPLLVGRHDERGHPAVGRADPGLSMGGRVGLRVELDAQERGPLEHRSSQLGRGLTDAGGH